MKEKKEVLEKQIKQMKGADSLRSVNFKDLCIQSSLKFPPEFNAQTLKSTVKKKCLYICFKLYGASMVEYGNEDKLLL